MAHEVSQRSPFSVYVHYPFCRSRCAYCSFPTTAPHAWPQERYARAVSRELEQRAGGYEAGTLVSLYLGGGTPSLWQGEQVARVVSAVLGRFSQAGETEVTVEANPASLSRSWLERLRGAGVNRLSLGVQSLDDEVLAMLGRRHTAAGARGAMSMARDAGIQNLGCDVIFGVPGQSVEHHLAELDALTTLGPDHISTYGLTLAPEAPLRRTGRVPASDDVMAQMMRTGRQALRDAGYSHYEVSNYCRPSRHSRHNSALWAGLPYLGLGAHAHSARFQGPVSLRRANPGPDRYMALWSGPDAPAPPHGAAEEQVDEQGSRLEVLMLGLRARAGVLRARYRDRFGADLTEHYGQQIHLLERDGFVRLDDDSLRPTRRGIWFADELALRITRRN